MLSLPFFQHWFKKKMKNIMHLSHKVHVKKGAVLQEEGQSNDSVFIVREGQFQLTKKVKKDIPVTAEHERVREFLIGTQAKRSVRSIINSKINKVTKMSGLTQKTTYKQEEEISIIGMGQIFGEGRFLQIYERQQK